MIQQPLSLDDAQPLLVLPPLPGFSATSAPSQDAERPGSGRENATPSSSGAVGQTTVPSAAMEAVMAAHVHRRTVLERTPLDDLELNAGALPQRAMECVIRARDTMMYGRDGWRAKARQELAKAGAMVLAAIDYLDNGGGE